MVFHSNLKMFDFLFFLGQMLSFNDDITISILYDNFVDIV